MTEFYRRAAACALAAECHACTVLEGDRRGEKALFQAGTLIYADGEKDFWRQHSALRQGNGIVVAEGVRVFCESLSSEKRLIVCGGGHVGIALIRMAVLSGFAVCCVEDRPEYAQSARKAGAEQILCGPFGEMLEKIPGGPDCYFAVLTRGHQYDQLCLEKICRKESAYVGMIGSRRHAAAVRAGLEKAGVSSAAIAAVHSPIGLDIDAETPAEIAVSILAEIIAVKNRQARSGGYSRTLLRALEQLQKPGVVVTVVERRGSAPRAAGARMLVGETQTVGSIGGGEMERQAVQQAHALLESGEKTLLRTMDLSIVMACGGEVTLFWERVDGGDGQ